MTQLPEDNTSNPDNRLTEDLSCIGCGYNLRHQPAEGECSECGRAIADSLNADYRWFADVRFLRQAALGMALFTCTVALPLVSVMGMGMIGEPAPFAAFLPCCFLVIMWPLSLAMLSFVPPQYMRLSRRFGFERVGARVPATDTVSGVWVSGLAFVGAMVIAICGGAGTQSGLFVSIFAVIANIALISHLFLTLALAGGLAELLESSLLDRLWRTVRLLLWLIVVLVLGTVVVHFARGFGSLRYALQIAIVVACVACMTAAVVAGVLTAYRFNQRRLMVGAMRDA